MASSINAATAGAGGVITTADNSGVLNLQSGGVTVATINSTGIVMASTTAPAFSAYNTSSQSVTASTFTKVTLDTEVFDTNSNFASSRFTPTVAGYYQLNGTLRATGTAMTGAIVALYRSGSLYAYGGAMDGVSATSTQLVVSEIVYLNGSTDYVELWGYITATSPSFGYAANYINCRFSGAMIRSA